MRLATESAHNNKDRWESPMSTFRRLRLAPAMAHARRLLAAAAVLLAAGTAAHAVSDDEGLRSMNEVLQRSLDDPKAALALAAQRLAVVQNAGDRSAEFWLRLAMVDVHVQVDQAAAAAREIEAAQRAQRASGAAPRRRLWLDMYITLAAASPSDAAAFKRRQEELRAGARQVGDEELLCRLNTVDAVVYHDLQSNDEAWSALEAVEACGRRLGDVGTQAYALGTMGLLASRVGAQHRPQVYFDRALQVLGTQPARFQRAWLLDDLAWARVERRDLAAARDAFEQSHALSRELGDVSGTMRGHEGLAEVLLQLGDSAEALANAREALRLAETDGLLYRRVTAQSQVVRALTQLNRRPELGDEIEKLRAMSALDASPRAGSIIARSVAGGYAALGDHARAYAELQRFLELSRLDEQSRRDSQAQRLQARYEAVRRDAEVRELRHREEAARLELAARTERQRALWAVVAALLALLAVGTWTSIRALRRRRRLADLALRDELTGLPNRRAVLAFAREQFNLARRLETPLAVALIDLDRFKQVNDTHGHAAGDRVLQAFAAAAHGVLRGQDRIGRYGGEEWLLVMPGTRAGELAPVFERLRTALAAQNVAGMPQPHGVSFSMGGAEVRAGIDSLDALIAEADSQLYRAKAHGRDAMCSLTEGVVRSDSATFASAA
jgi:diguanylate cyclase (GGDEF)-like protein